ncbi:hypothetical protein GCM10010435_87290 [Winogradskya consettensis]|uniref:Uncharacterized protein n=1 Tax=Winogradskya consettensis TaxID=113560 RepID=A0A919T027_9ACTN|nr:hypothetical protein [Actinoplanes consettensis]GIM80854.1 hypothetical protein Aco04nite_73140 [Actinoplanes consettensis]
MTDWPTLTAEATAAEAREDWAAAIALVSAVAECYSEDYMRHNAHLWHVDLLVRAGLLHELTRFAGTDKHARRRLARFLYDEGRADDLRERAATGDKAALYPLIRLLRARGEHEAAEQVAAELAPADSYARELAGG